VKLELEDWAEEAPIQGVMAKRGPSFIGRPAGNRGATSVAGRLAQELLYSEGTTYEVRLTRKGVTAQKEEKNMVTVKNEAGESKGKLGKKKGS